MNDPLKPSATLLIKLGSLIVHLEEQASSKGHHVDAYAIAALQQDPEVIEWMKKMTGMAFLPVKR